MTLRSSGWSFVGRRVKRSCTSGRGVWSTRRLKSCFFGAEARMREVHALGLQRFDKRGGKARCIEVEMQSGDRVRIEAEEIFMRVA